MDLLRDRHCQLSTGALDFCAVRGEEESLSGIEEATGVGGLGEKWHKQCHHGSTTAI